MIKFYLFMLLRKCTINDFSQVIRLIAKPNKYNQFSVITPQLVERNYFCMENPDKKMVSCGGWEFDDDNDAKVQMCYTHPDYRRQGLAREIMNNVCEHVQNDGYNSVYAICLDEARNFFEKCGFEPTYGIKFNKDYPDFIMEKVFSEDNTQNNLLYCGKY